MKRIASTAHRWRFCRLGGFDQVRLESGEDILHLHQLDQKLWAALSCPVTGLEFDAQTLALLDSDNDGRIRVQEILAAVDWTCSLLHSPDSLLEGMAALPLAAIDSGKPEGQQLLDSARQLLAYCGKPELDFVSIEDVADTTALLLESTFNGDGIVPPHAAGDEATRLLIEDIITCLGSDEDRSGVPGISSERVEAFFAAAQAYRQWWQLAEEDAALLPLGERTLEAAKVYNALKPKVDDYFIRCRLASYDPKAEEPLNPATVTYETLAGQELQTDTVELTQMPLARIRAGRALPLHEGINPSWVNKVEDLTRLVITPLVGEVEQLEESQWRQIKTIWGPFEAWQAEKAGTEVERLGLERLRAILAGQGREQLQQLIENDLNLADQVTGIDNVVRMVHYHRDLYRLLNNFVTFRDFYAQNPKAIFQAGTLYIDGRACELCVRVESVEGHCPLANLSRTYLAYCSCKRRNSGDQMVIAVALTGGDADNLMVGRNGVFYDRQGNDWDATIVKIIDHPISVSQAFWAPYKRIARMFGEQIEKIAATKMKTMDSKAQAGIADVGNKASSGGQPAAPFDVGKFAGIFAAIGLAIGAIGTAIASIIGGFLDLSIWEMPLAVGGILLAVSGPSMLIAYLKLRQRNLGPLLDANGWAVNTKAIINIPFGATLTTLAELPKGAERRLSDPFAEKKTPWKRWIVLVALLSALGFAWKHGYIQKISQQFKPMLIEKLQKSKEHPVAPVQKNTDKQGSEKKAEPAGK
ncbi:MAG: hypothetical protein AB7U29_03860 [Desulfobulbus sp.]